MNWRRRGAPAMTYFIVPEGQVKKDTQENLLHQKVL